MTIEQSKMNVPNSIVPDGGWGWMIVLASFMIHFIMDGITYSIGDIFLGPMMERLNSIRGPVSGIFGVLPAVTLATGPIATILTNKYGCRKMTIYGSILAALGFSASSIFPNLYFYYFSIGIIGGLGLGLIYLPAIVSVGFYFEQKRSFAMGIAVCGSGLGTLIFPLLMPYVIDSPLWLDYDGALLLEGAFIFVCVLFGLIMIPLPQEPSEIRRLEKKSKAKNITDQQKEKIEMENRTKHNRNDLNRDQNERLLSNDEREKNSEQEIRKEKGRESSAIVPNDKELSKLNASKTSLNKDSKESNEIQEEAQYVLSRKDAVYQGSLHNIPLFNEDPDEYHRQIITTSKIDLRSDDLTKNIKKKTFLKQITENIDLNLLKDISFALFALSNFLTSLGFNVPYAFANDLAKDAQVIESQRSWVVMSMGIGNCFGRIIIGYLADRSWFNRLYLYNTTLIIAGIATMAAPFCNSNVITHMIYASSFGFFSGGYVGLTSIVVVDLVGVDKLSDAFGTLLLFQGVAVGIGIPIVGTMRDMFSDFERPYLWPYTIFGGFIMISGLILFAIPIIKKYEENRQSARIDRIKMGVRSYSEEKLSQQKGKQHLEI